MSNYNELEIAYCAALIINKFPSGISTQNLLIMLRSIMKPKGNDTLLLKNRADDLFSQKVRNLKSHNTLEKLIFAKYNNKKFFPIKKDILKKNIINFNKKYPEISLKFKSSLFLN
tara:strand:+ start:37 stop:381 length:345 start_codon:yes stop_codon:yes gene_type:complete